MEKDTIEKFFNHNEVLRFALKNQEVIDNITKSIKYDFFQLDESRDLLIICDDFHLDFGKIRFRSKGSSGGQRGLEDVIRHLGSDFCRLRIGIGSPPDGWNVPDYVLSRFREEELEEKKECVSRAATAALFWAEHTVADAMNRFNSNEKSGTGGESSATTDQKDSSSHRTAPEQQKTQIKQSETENQ